MKALVYEGPQQLHYKEIEDPTPAEGETLVRIVASGICGSDMHAYYGHDSRRVPPLVLGHEAVGEALNGIHTGTFVALNPLITCGDCDYCRRNLSNLCPNRMMHGMTHQGFYAEIVSVPNRNVIPLPESMLATHAALIEPTGCVYRAVSLAQRVLNRPLVDSRVMTLGAGAIGLLTSLMLENMGCSEILTGDTSDLRRKVAGQALNSSTFDPLQQTFHNEFDLVIDAVGSPQSRLTAIEAVAPGGTILHIGLQDGAGGLDARVITLKEIAFLGTYAYTHDDLSAALDLLQSGKLGDLAWIEERPLAEGAEAFRALAAHEVAAPKILLRTN